MEFQKKSSNQFSNKLLEEFCKTFNEEIIKGFIGRIPKIIAEF